MACSSFALATAVARLGEAEAGLSYPAESLLLDIERMVDAEESEGWFIDNDAVLDLRQPLLESLCRTPPAARNEAVRALEAESARAGDARSLYEAEGRKVTAIVEQARFVERKLFALRTAVAWGTDCPVWVEPEANFEGRQTDRDRFTISFESGGNAQIRRTQNTWTIGAGGLGRGLVGYGFSGDFSVLAGFEFGGGAMLKPGVEPTEFVVNYFPAIPVILRLHNVSWHYDLELAPVSLFQADNARFSFGFRTGVGVGLAGLLLRGVIPWAGAVLSYEHYFHNGRRDSADFLRGGVRVGVIWDG
jgi:hypothetical protein